MAWPAVNARDFLQACMLTRSQCPMQTLTRWIFGSTVRPNCEMRSVVRGEITRPILSIARLKMLYMNDSWQTA